MVEGGGGGGGDTGVVAGGMRLQRIPFVGSSHIGFRSLITMSRDSVFVIEGADDFGNHEVAVYEFQTHAWRVLCKLSAAT